MAKRACRGPPIPRSKIDCSSSPIRVLWLWPCRTDGCSTPSKRVIVLRRDPSCLEQLQIDGVGHGLAVQTIDEAVKRSIVARTQGSESAGIRPVAVYRRAQAEW